MEKCVDLGGGWDWPVVIVSLEDTQGSSGLWRFSVCVEEARGDQKNNSADGTVNTSTCLLFSWAVFF